MIGCLLEDIRRVVKLYDENIDHVSMYISEVSSNAVALSDDEESKYLLNVDVFQEVEK